MHCAICGISDDLDVVKFIPNKYQSLCPDCNAGTPSKLGRRDFDTRYWGDELDLVNPGIRREFWKDYIASDLSFKEYVHATTAPADL